MSIPHDEIVTCPKCGHRFETTLWETVNCEIDADLPQKLISGEFFSRVCPGCGNTFHVEHPLLYNDLDHDTFIQVVQSEKEYRSALEQGDFITSMIANYRVVLSTAALSGIAPMNAVTRPMPRPSARTGRESGIDAKKPNTAPKKAVSAPSSGRYRPFSMSSHAGQRLT